MQPIQNGPSAMMAPAQREALHQASVRLEASFLAEMLKASGFGEQKGAFGGGAGADHFTSFHTEAIAERMAAAGGIGLAEHIFASLVATQTGGAR